MLACRKSRSAPRHRETSEVDVADILRGRVGEPDGFQRMAVVSALAHAAVFALLILTPGSWLALHDEAPKTVMTITLDGGNGGPNNGGMTSIGGKGGQAETPGGSKGCAPQTGPAPGPPQNTGPIPAKTPAQAAQPAPELKQGTGPGKRRPP